MRIADLAQRMAAADLQTLSGLGAPLREVLECYAQYMFDQVGLSVACARLHSLDQRCARWLLTTDDRVGAGTFVLTQEHLASLLGVHRPAVSVAQKALERRGAIAYSRGRVEVRDRAALESVACECYREDMADFDRLFGRAGRKRPNTERS